MFRGKLAVKRPRYISIIILDYNQYLHVRHVKLLSPTAQKTKMIRKQTMNVDISPIKK